jgi:GPI mannosyltransferase 3
MENCFNTLTPCFQLFSQMVNWFMFFCITRTLSNSLETVLTTVGIFYWCLAIATSKKSNVDSSRKLALAIAALACAVRPTSAITWFYVGLMDLFQVRSKFKFIFLEVVPLG